MRNRYQLGGTRKQEERSFEPRQPHLEFVSKQDLLDLKTELLEAIHSQKEKVEKSPQDRIKKRFLKTGDLMKILGLSRNTINDLRTSNALPAVRVHGIYLFDVDDVEKFIEDNKR